MSSYRLQITLAVGLAGCAVAPSWADIITIQSTTAGWYRSDGLHFESGTLPHMNYLAQGNTDPNQVYHDYFIFDLSTLSGVVLSARLSAYNNTAAEGNAVPGYKSSNASELLTLYDVTTPVATIRTQRGAGDLTGKAVFTDLGSGTTFGSQTVSASDNGADVHVTLNSDAISLIQSSEGGTFLMGGALPSDALGADIIFSGTASRIPTLIVTTTPEPTTCALLVGPASILLARRRRVARARG